MMLSTKQDCQHLRLLLRALPCFIYGRYAVIESSATRLSYQPQQGWLGSACACTLLAIAALVIAARTTAQEQVIIMQGMGILLQRQSLLASWLGNTSWHVHTFVDAASVRGLTVVEHIGCGAVTSHAAVVTDKGHRMVVMDECLGGTVACASEVYQAATAALQLSADKGGLG